MCVIDRLQGPHYLLRIIPYTYLCTSPLTQPLSYLLPHFLPVVHYWKDYRFDHQPFIDVHKALTNYQFNGCKCSSSIS